MINARQTRRGGLTLLEVILALTILGLTLSTVSILATLGRRAASASRDVAEAQLICQTVMAEIAAGIMPPQAIPPTAYAMNPLWQVDVVVIPTETESLLLVEVGAQRIDDLGGRSRFQLVRLVPDPTITDQIAAAAASDAAAETLPADGQATGNELESQASPFGASNSFGGGPVGEPASGGGR